MNTDIALTTLGFCVGSMIYATITKQPKSVTADRVIFPAILGLLIAFSYNVQ